MTSHSASRLCGSRPDVGSSRNSTSGSCMIARATISRCAMPPDSSSTLARGPVGEPELLEQLVGPAVCFPGAHAEVTTVEEEVLGDVERAVERVGLRHDADDLLGRRRAGRPRRCRRRRLARGRDHPGREHADGRGLAGAVRAEQPEDLAPVHGQVERLDGAHLAAAAVEDLGERDRADDAVVAVGSRARLRRAARRSSCVRSYGRRAFGSQVRDARSAPTRPAAVVVGGRR